MQNGRLHAAVAVVNRDLSRVCAENRDDANRANIAALSSSWRDLVELLALGPAPELRNCPECGNVGMRAATLCGYCWTRLTPPPR